MDGKVDTYVEQSLRGLTIIMFSVFRKDITKKSHGEPTENIDICNEHALKRTYLQNEPENKSKTLLDCDIEGVKSAMRNTVMSDSGTQTENDVREETLNPPTESIFCDENTLEQNEALRAELEFKSKKLLEIEMELARIKSTMTDTMNEAVVCERECQTERLELTENEEMSSLKTELAKQTRDIGVQYEDIEKHLSEKDPEIEILEEDYVEHISSKNGFESVEQDTELSDLYDQTIPNFQEPKKEERYRCPEEDKTGRWRMCACGKDTCLTCLSEKAAVMKVKSCPSCRVTNVPRFDDPEGQSSKDQDDFTEYTLRLPGECNCYQCRASRDDKGNYYYAAVLTDIGTNGEDSTKYIYVLHQTLSDSTLDGKKTDSKACAMITMMFASKFIQDPPLLYESHVPIQLYQQIIDSIREGRETFELNCSDPSTKLGPADTLLINNHLGLCLREEHECTTMIHETLLHYMMNLQQGQILQFYRMDDYKVMSIFCAQDESHLILFDSQPHHIYSKTLRKDVVYGGLVYNVIKEMPVLMKTIDMIEYYNGIIKGKCILAKFEH